MIRSVPLSLLAALGISPLLAEQATFEPPRCEIIPLPRQEVSFRIDGIERCRWHFGKNYPRPFFYPLKGPSGTTLTRMGHPGAANHDHHQSIWFAHHDVEGESFWANGANTRIEQTLWYAYRDGSDEAIMATGAIWRTADGTPLIEQETVASLRPHDRNEIALELQITLAPARGRESTELGQTNFGLLGVRVAKSLSHHFGGGRLTSSEGAVGEEAIFEERARWVDYSGPVVTGTGADREVVTEGITYFDHPDNPRHPCHWHVRSDGWMGASFCHSGGWTLTPEEPLVLRYLLHAHGGDCDPGRADAIAASFASRSGFVVGKATRPHRQFDVFRESEIEDPAGESGD